MPPWMSRDECEDVPPPKSPLSTRAVRKPRNAASRAIPAPVIPPPMTSTSTGSAAIDSSAATRVRNENGVSSDNSRPSGGRGRFRACYVLRGECNAAEKRTARGGCRRLPHAVLQVGDVVLAGGVESLPGIPILASRRLADILVEASKAKTLGARLRTFSRIRPRDLVPVSPAIAEPSTGETMGQSAEKMAKQNHIARDAQDRWALRSHELAARGTDDGRLTAEIAPWFPERPAEPVLTTDNGIRRDTSLEQMAKLRPVFDRQYGSVTAANSSPLTDGASAVLVMSDEAARALGYTPLAYVRSYAVAAVDPGWQLLQAPIFAVPTALERAGIQWADLGLIEVHEAFAAQVLSNFQGWAAKGWEINPDIINVMGGSIAIGHPFGATGGRIVTTLANEMARRDVQFGLLSICAQGGMGIAVVLERR